MTAWKTNTNSSWTFIKTLIGVTLVCGTFSCVAIASLNPTVPNTTTTSEPINYVICKDVDGTIHQAKGTRITVDDKTVIVRSKDGKETVFINMNCWTEYETIKLAIPPQQK